VAVLPPDAKVYSLTAAGQRDLVEEWSEKARTNLAQALANQMARPGRLALKGFDLTQSPAAQREYEEARPLFEAVALSVLAHAYQHVPLRYAPLKESIIDYSLGPLPSLAEASAADALLFVYASDHISTGGRIVAGILFTVTIGLLTKSTPVGGQTLIVTALVDPLTGDCPLGQHAGFHGPWRLPGRPRYARSRQCGAPARGHSRRFSVGRVYLEARGSKLPRHCSGRRGNQP